MKIGVLVKTVKFVYAQTGTDLQTNYVGPDDSVHMLNPLDEVALEYALQLKDRDPKAQVVVIACGDQSAELGLRRGLAMGADRALHVSCEQSDELDAFASAQLLSQTCQREGFNLILCGATALDDNEGLEGPYVAERLGIPFASNVVHIAVNPDQTHLEVQRVVERSDRQLWECRLPALLTVEKSSKTPRYPLLAGFLRAKDATLTVVSPEDLGFSVMNDLPSLNLTRLAGYSRPKPKKKASSGKSLPPVAQRLDFMVNGDSSGDKSGKIVEGGSAEMFNRLDAILATTGVLKD